MSYLFSSNCITGSDIGVGGHDMKERRDDTQEINKGVFVLAIGIRKEVFTLDEVRFIFSLCFHE